jgi:hypothetical protein
MLKSSLGRSIAYPDLEFLVDSFFCGMNIGLTPCNRDHTEKKKPTDIKLVIKFNGTQKFFTVLSPNHRHYAVHAIYWFLNSYSGVGSC